MYNWGSYVLLRTAGNVFCSRFIFILVLGTLTVSFVCVNELPGETGTAAHFGKLILSIEYSSDSPLDRTHYDPYIGLRPGDTLTRTGLKEAIQSLYDSRRFSSIIAEAVPEADGVRLQFLLQHNYYFNKFSLEGDFDLKGRSLWEWVSLPVGKSFSWESLQESRIAVQDFLKNQGYFLAKVRANIEWDHKAHQVNVVCFVQTGELALIRDVNIVGMNERDNTELLDKFGFKKGERFDRTRLTDRMDDLRKHFIDEGYFAVIPDVYEDINLEDNSIALIVTIHNPSTVRVLVDGYDIDRNQLQRILSVLTEKGSREEIMDRGAEKLKEYLKTRGYPGADVAVNLEAHDGTYILRYRINRGKKSVVDYVQFQECTAFPEKEILDTVAVRPSAFLQGSIFSTELLDQGKDALQSLYESRGYLGADIDYTYRELGNTERYLVTYQCLEGPLSSVHSVAFEGNAAFETGELASRIGLKQGEAYSAALAERDRQILLAIYSDAGYLKARVNVNALAVDASDAYAVEFHIEEGTQFLVDRILVLGNEHTRRSVIENRVKLSSGDPLSLGKLLETQQALYRIGVFDQVRVTQQNPESKNPHHNIVVRLRESKRFTIRYGLGYQEREKLRGILEFSDLNLLGLARRADIRLRGSSKEQEAVFNLRQTQFHHLPVDSYLSFSASYRQEEFGDIRRLGASYQFSQPINNHSWAMARYNFKNVHVIFDRSVLEVSEGENEEELEREDRPVNLSTFSVAYINDSRDNYLDPTVGFFSSSEFGITTKLLGEKNYISFFTQNSYFRRLPKSFMTAVSLRVGVIHPYGGSDVPISERFFAGGGSSLRGFDTDFAGPLDMKQISETEREFTPKGGNALFIGSVELRRPVLSIVHLAGFYDTGNVFERINDFRFAGFSHIVGAGLRIKTPLGPLRIDYGYNLNLPADLEFPESSVKGLDRGHLYVTVGPPF